MKILFSILVVLAPFLQEDGIITSFKVEGKLLGVDQLGNVFTGNKDVLTKYNAAGVKLNTYSNKLLGQVTSLDVKNPLRYLVYYQDIGRIIFLDNTLSVHNEITLDQHNLDQTTLACSSNNDAFWVYDAIEFRLLKIDEQVKIVQNSGNLIQLLGAQINPTFLTEVKDKIYLNDPLLGIFVFDIYAGFVKKIPLLGLERFTVIDNQIIYNTNDSIINFNMINLTDQKLDVTSQKAEIIFPSKKNFYFQKGNVIEVTKF